MASADFLKVTPGDDRAVFTYRDLKRALARADELGVSDDEPIRVVTQISLSAHGAPITAVFVPVKQ